MRFLPDSLLERVAVCAILGAFVVTAAFYLALPPEFPIHLNRAFEIDGTMAKPMGPFVLPLISIALFLLSRTVARALSSFYPPTESLLTNVLALVPLLIVALQFVLLAVVIIR